jgi:myo-inositol-1(or 4)-monophosphatase
MIGPKDLFTHPGWQPAWPAMTIVSKAALAFRLATVAAGQGDAALSLGYKQEWDIAAGALLIAEAGGRITDPWGQPLCFNQPDPRVPGIVASGPNLHELLIERAQKTPHPSVFASTA